MKGRGSEDSPRVDPVNRPGGVQRGNTTMLTPASLKALFKKASSARRRTMAAMVTLGVVALSNPSLGYAQQTMNAQALTPEGVALTATDLGPEWSVAAQNTETLADGTKLSYTRFSSASGRAVNLTTAVAPNPDYAEAVVSYLRYQVESNGLTVSSVQNNGYGDGRAFKGEATVGRALSIVYMFRVRHLIALVDYVGSTASVGDIETQAVTVARKQEARFFAAFAPPPTPTPVPTPEPSAVPTATPAPTAAVSVPPTATAPDAVTAPTAPHCQPGETPQFRLGFVTLSAQLGGRMGNPTSCPYRDPAGSGDTLQDTDAGLGIYRASSDTVTFTNGSDHWALVGGRAVHWTGDSLDPPDDAETVGG